jgi:hypothetical protein
MSAQGQWLSSNCRYQDLIHKQRREGFSQGAILCCLDCLPDMKHGLNLTGLRGQAYGKNSGQH